MTTTITEDPVSKILDSLPGYNIADEPATRVRRVDITRSAMGDSQDPYGFDERMWAHRIIETMHRRNFEIRREKGFPRKHDAETILLPGRGQQSRVAAYYISQLYAAGVPVLHNGELLFGRCIHTCDIPDLCGINVAQIGGAALFVDEIHTINQVYSPDDNDTQVQFDTLKRMGYWSCFGTSWPMMVGPRLMDQVDEVWRGVGLSVFDAEPLKIVKNQDYPPSAMLHRWFGNGGSTPKSRVNFLRAVISSEELGTNHEPKPYLTQALDWGWGQMALMLLDEYGPLSIGVGKGVKRDD